MPFLYILLGFGLAEFYNEAISRSVENTVKSREQIQELLCDEEKFHAVVIKYLNKLQQEGQIVVNPEMITAANTNNQVVMPAPQYGINNMMPAVMQK